MGKKRKAQKPLEDVAPADSPSSKRARMEDASDDEASNGRTPSRNGNSMPIQSPHEEMTDENAAEQLQRETQEAGAAAAVDGDEEESAYTAPARQSAPTEGYGDLYLDTINRSVLDFDFEKLCSITLSNINVYACLVCGRYFQGRGHKSQAYFHSLDESHHVYVNMETKKVYVLPEGYEVHSKSLDDIKFVVDPRLSKADVHALDRDAQPAWDLIGRQYIPGFVGMNNIKANDYFNVVIHSLAHVQPLRNFFMLEDLAHRPQLAQRFGILVRKIWNPRAFKAHVSPHELLQSVSQASNKRFTLTAQADPVDFLSWFLNNLHLALGGSRSKPGSSIVQRVFQGALKLESQQITARADAGDRLRFEDAAVHTQVVRYLILTLDLPAAPLFQDELEKNIIPQVPLTSVLGKYDGIRAQEKMNTRVRYRLLHPLPPCLCFHVKRFSANKFVSERNPTIVTFPVRSLDMAPYVEPNPELWPLGEPIWYDLVANITHEAVRTRDDSVEGEKERKVWRVQVKEKSREEWFEVQDLFVEKARSETLFTKESYLLVWERRKGQGKTQSKGKGKAI